MAIETIVTNRGLHVHHSNEPRNRGHRFQGDTEVQDYAVHRLLHLLRDPHDAVRRPWNVRLDELPNHEGINGDNCSQDRFMIYHSGQVPPREDPRRPIYPDITAGTTAASQPGQRMHMYMLGLVLEHRSECGTAIRTAAARSTGHRLRVRLSKGVPRGAYHI
ncbi:hypothetical protein AcV5_006511 [Taiwanofungus camphoratus]|nr:hypothetical protein AcV5_006511 [Antrodia cinnamomea]